MINPGRIAELSERIVRQFAPERIVLFGSHAYGAPDEDSDVDLLVIMPYTGHPARKAAEILRAIQPRLPLDLIVRTPEEVCQRLAWNDFFLREIMEKGVVLYAAAHA
jgi:uncharacterized protein